MSRTQKGSKPLGWEYWGKRKGSGCVDRKTSHRMERMQHKEEDRKYIDESLAEVYGLNFRLDSCPTFKSLFPQAKTIEYYHHWIFGYDVLVVDGNHFGELSEANELLAYAYHTGVSYKDYDDLSMKYYEHLECGNERWDFLP